MDNIIKFFTGFVLGIILIPLFILFFLFFIIIFGLIIIFLPLIGGYSALKVND